MLSVEPIFERTLRMSGAGAVPGRAVGLVAVLAVVDVVDAVGRGARGTRGFFSGAVAVVEDSVAGLAAAVRVRDAAVVEVVLLEVAEVVLGLVESAVEVLTVVGFFSSPGLLSVLEARGFLAAALAVVRAVDAAVRTDEAVLLAAVLAVPFLAVGPEPG